MTSNQGLQASEKKIFLTLVRITIEFFLREGRTPGPTEHGLTLPAISKENLGVFVTLHKNKALRGCIGYVQGVKPLSEALIDNAINAATRDPRFPPVKAAELADIDIELSILSPVREISNIDEITVGVHGLIISKGFASGLLLPQVASEWGWSREEFLKHTCHKSGLPDDAWKTGAKIEIFSATVFGENDSK